MKTVDKQNTAGTAPAGETLSLARCRQILGAEAKGMSDDEVLQLRDDLSKMADVIIPAIGRATDKGTAPR